MSNVTINSKSRNKGTLKSTYAVKAQIYNEIERIKKEIKKASQAENSKNVLTQDANTLTADAKTSQDTTDKNTEGINSQAIEEQGKRAPESSEERSGQWLNPVNDIIKFYISNMKK